MDGIEDKAFLHYQKVRRLHWDMVACNFDRGRGLGGNYHKRLDQIYRNTIAPGQRILEIGCGSGGLLAATKPGFGVGVDFSFEMVRRAQEKYPDLFFIQADAHRLCLNIQFDIVILSDLLNDVWDVQTVFREIQKVITPRTRIVINSYSRLWEIPLAVAQWLKIAKPIKPQNWLTVEDIDNLLFLEDFEVINQWQEIILPLPIPILSKIFNCFLVKLWPFKFLALTNIVIAFPRSQALISEPSVSVVIPARNEAGNILELFERTPEMGQYTELIFVEGHSSDNTYDVIKSIMTDHPERRCQLFRQEGEGKGDAVRMGFANAGGDILMILDADLTVPPEALPRFYIALREGKGSFINGVRLMYPMEDQAMRFVNLIGNKFFGVAFSWILGQPIKDTLCGTKALWKRDYELISNNRDYFGDFDPFGDFDLLFGAAKQNMKIVDVPIRYRSRTYGGTNIDRWRHGWMLVRMVIFAARRLKFI
ncbi:MAG: glycosyl transferase [Chloroflexi bacterium RBG_16_48_8]|nr:MAG: glycosyl transferase [Chloroflexi bacterium RBG_16_48_8]